MDSSRKVCDGWRRITGLSGRGCTTNAKWLHTARAYGRFREAGATMKMDDVAAGIAKSKEEKRNVEKRLD